AMSRLPSTIMRQRQKPRRGRTAAAIAVLLLSVSCTAGPSQRPPLATFGGEAAPATTAPTTSTSSLATGPGGPGRDVPPVAWGACPAGVASTTPDGTELSVRCASVAAPIIYRQPHRGGLTL